MGSMGYNVAYMGFMGSMGSMGRTIDPATSIVFGMFLHNICVQGALPLTTQLN